MTAPTPIPWSPTDGKPVPARTVADWLARATSDGLVDALEAARNQADTAAAGGVWIHRCPPAVWARQMALLAQRRAESTDAADLLARYPLLGVPFAVKDNIDIVGEPTTAACPAFAHAAARSATVVQRLLDAGAVWLGKTNLDQFATGLVGTRSPYGRPSCIADAARISGGSSSGSAVAVARGFVAFALGTDTAGSGRVPAGFNGLVGLKPTPGRVSTAGVLPACRTLDCVSIFAHSVDDAAHVLAVIEGPDGADPYIADPYSAAVAGPLALPPRLRLGVPAAPTLDAAVGYPAAWAAACAAAAANGHELVAIDMAPLQAVAALLYDGPWVAERHAVVRALLAEQPDALDPVVRRVIEKAGTFTATDAFEARYRLQALRAELAGLWGRIDVLMVPTAPTHPRFDDVDADPVGVNAALGTYTNFVNLLGWCALAVPAGSTSTGLPFGVTYIAPGGCDAALAAWAGAASGAAAAQPAAAWRRTPATQPTLPLAVVGAHLSGLPLNHQLTRLGGVLLQATQTAPAYRLYALPGTVPPKPALQRQPQADSGSGSGSAIAVEVWSLPLSAVGAFLAQVPPPLALGSLELADGRWVHGFVCEGHALAGALDITQHGGWRAYLGSVAPTPAAVPTTAP